MSMLAAMLVDRDNAGPATAVLVVLVVIIAVFTLLFLLWRLLRNLRGSATEQMARKALGSLHRLPVRVLGLGARHAVQRTPLRAAASEREAGGGRREIQTLAVPAPRGRTPAPIRRSRTETHVPPPLCTPIGEPTPLPASLSRQFRSIDPCGPTTAAQSKRLAVTAQVRTPQPRD
jgi:hypothetical protein